MVNGRETWWIASRGKHSWARLETRLGERLRRAQCGTSCSDGAATVANQLMKFLHRGLKAAAKSLGGSFGGKSVLVIGSVKPWLEGMVLALGDSTTRVVSLVLPPRRVPHVHHEQVTAISTRDARRLYQLGTLTAKSDARRAPHARHTCRDTPYVRLGCERRYGYSRGWARKPGRGAEPLGRPNVGGNGLVHGERASCASTSPSNALCSPSQRACQVQPKASVQRSHGGATSSELETCSARRGRTQRSARVRARRGRSTHSSVGGNRTKHVVAFLQVTHKQHTSMHKHSYSKICSAAQDRV